MAKKDNIIAAPMSLGDLLLNTPSAIIVANSQGRIISVSSATKDLLGWVPGELIGKSLSILIPKRLQEYHNAGFRHWSETGELKLAGKTLRTTATHKDGHEFPVQLTLGSYTSEEGDLRVVGMIDNIQEVIDLERRSDELQRELDFVRSVVMNLGEGVIAVDLDGKITLANPMATHLLGWTEDEMRGQNSHYLFHSNEANNFMRYEDCYIHKAIVEKGIFSSEDFFKTKDNRVIAVAITFAPIYRDGLIVGAVDIFSDITKKKKEQDELLLSEKKYRDLVELSPDGIAVHTNGEFVFANRALLDLMKAESFDDIEGMTIFDFILPEYHDFIRNRIGVADRDDGKLTLAQEKGRDLEGHIVDIEVATMPVIYLGRPAIISIVRDITSKIKDQEYRYMVNGIVNGNDDSIIGHRIDGSIVVWNRSSERLYGWTEEEMAGKNIRDIVVDEDYFEQTLSLVYEGRRIDHQTVNRKRKDGTLVKVDINVSSVENPEGVVIGASEIGREFSESQIISSNDGPAISGGTTVPA